MLFLQEEVQHNKQSEKGQKGGISKGKESNKTRKPEINTDFMYINYEI